MILTCLDYSKRIARCLLVRQKPDEPACFSVDRDQDLEASPDGSDASDSFNWETELNPAPKQNYRLTLSIIFTPFNFFN